MKVGHAAALPTSRCHKVAGSGARSVKHTLQILAALQSACGYALAATTFCEVLLNP